MAFDFPGGIGSINIQDVAAMDGTGTIDLTFEKKQIVKEGSEFPDPEALTVELADDREGRLGLDQELSIRLKKISTANFDSLEGAVGETDLWIKVSSFATVSGASTPKVETTYKEVLLSNATKGPVKVDRDTVGVVILDGKCTGHRTSDIMDVVHN